MAPQLLDFQGKVGNDFITTMKIIRHYGGERFLSKNPESLGQVNGKKLLIIAKIVNNQSN